jgi:hypothetical protein
MKTLLSELPNGNSYRITANGRVIPVDQYRGNNRNLNEYRGPVGPNRDPWGFTGGPPPTYGPGLPGNVQENGPPRNGPVFGPGIGPRPIAHQARFMRPLNNI